MGEPHIQQAPESHPASAASSHRIEFNDIIRDRRVHFMATQLGLLATEMARMLNTADAAAANPDRLRPAMRAIYSPAKPSVVS